MLSKYGRLGIAVAMLAALALLAGCAATTTAIRYQDLDVQTKMSHTIFLDPVAANQRTIFVQIRNTSDKPFDIQGEIMSALMAKGYRIEQDPAKAHYILQGNVLAVGRTDQSALENATAMGFGGVAAGAAAGALLGGSHAWEGAAIGGLAAGAAEVIAGSMVKVIWYAAITDIQISERVAGAVSEEFSSTLKQGSAQTYTKQRTASTGNVKKYQTRIASSARKVNLEFPEAEPYLRQGLVQSISGMF